MNFVSLPKAQYDCCRTFVFSEVFQAIMSEAARRFARGIPVTAVMAGISLAAEDRGWTNVATFIRRETGWDGSGADHAAVEVVRAVVNSKADRSRPGWADVDFAKSLFDIIGLCRRPVSPEDGFYYARLRTPHGWMPWRPAEVKLGRVLILGATWAYLWHDKNVEVGPRLQEPQVECTSSSAA